MPKQPLFESTWARQSAISVAMGAVLVAVVGLALATTRGHVVQLPGATVEVPVTWERMGTAGDGAAKVFELSEDDPRRLVVAGYRFPQQVTVDTATEAMTQRLQGIVPPMARAAEEVNVVSGQRIEGKHYFAESRSDRRAQLHWMATLSVDGQTYWTVYLTDASLNPRLGRGASAQYQQTRQRGTELLESVVNTLTLTD
jgi:hypothetical protein